MRALALTGVLPASGTRNNEARDGVSAIPTVNLRIGTSPPTDRHVFRKSITVHLTPCKQSRFLSGAGSSLAQQQRKHSRQQRLYALGRYVKLFSRPLPLEESLRVSFTSGNPAGPTAAQLAVEFPLTRSCVKVVPGTLPCADRKCRHLAAARGARQAHYNQGCTSK